MLDKIVKVYTKEFSGESPGCAVLITKNGGILHESYHGLANLEYRIPVTEKTVFDLASISKQFTAASIMLLKSEGRLSYDDCLRAFFPDIHESFADVTLRRLLWHTSGVPDVYVLMGALVPEERHFLLQPGALNLVLKHGAPSFPPGERFSYSNSGYILLALVVEKISGMGYGEFLFKNFFDPLGIKEAHVIDESRIPVIPNRAYGYVTIDGTYYDAESVERTDYDYGDGGIYTTPRNLLMWEQAVQSGKVLSPELFEEAFSAGKTNSGETIAYGFGVQIDEFKGRKRLWHAGTDAGFRSVFMRVPSKHISVILFSNNARFEDVRMQFGEELLAACLKN